MLYAKCSCERSWNFNVQKRKFSDAIPTKLYVILKSHWVIQSKRVELQSIQGEGKKIGNKGNFGFVEICKTVPVPLYLWWRKNSREQRVTVRVSRKQQSENRVCAPHTCEFFLTTGQNPKIKIAFFLCTTLHNSRLMSLDHVQLIQHEAQCSKTNSATNKCYQFPRHGGKLIRQIWDSRKDGSNM